LQELEWAECCEPSYFLEYDSVVGEFATTDDSDLGTDYVRDYAGRIVKSDAQRHDQHCSLNQLFNSPKGWIMDNVPCSVARANINERFGVAVTPLGAAFIPKSVIKSGKLPGRGGEFTAQVAFNETGKYNLRVRWVCEEGSALP
jgi:hypothetical protein